MSELPQDESLSDHQLLSELAEEFAAHYRLGEHPSIEDYALRNPKLAEEIRETFPALMAMENPGFGLTADFAAATERVGSTIGRYKLLEHLGEGGFGVVFMAEQQFPVRRKVAIKLIKPGVDTGQVIARFEAERQALAIMEHENIAKVLDAGSTEAGRPFFVMELVRGIPITEYCDKNRLPPRERLELFVQVCRAVQHAHTKGIIHRDIKPTNVLVTLHDGVPVPKVIDFGVAKATGQQLTERTLFTHFAQIIGTPLYMSPEQAKMSGLDVDTRSDVYSLGVLLYELLTGTTPVDKERLRQAAFDEVIRIIREEEPPKPSTRLSTAAALPSIAACRGLEPKKLSGLVRGELDWIVMKCLEKDRSRRYETVNGLAMDVQQYLHDEPVQACPPSPGYRLRKLARKHRVALTITLAFAALLTGASIISTWQAVRATRAEREQSRLRRQALTEAGIAQAINDFLNRDLLAQANPLLAYDRFKEPAPDLKLLTVLDLASTKLDGRFTEQPLVEAALRQTIGITYARLQNDRRAVQHLQRAVELRRRHLGEEHRETLTSMAALAWVKEDPVLIEQVVQMRRRTLGENDPDTFYSMFDFALAVRHKGDALRGIALFRELLASARRALGEDHWITAWTMHVLAATEQAWSSSKADDREREQYFRQALSVMRKVQGDGWYTYDVTLRFGQFLSSRHRFEEAESLFTSALARLRAMPGASAECVVRLNSELVAVYQKWGKPERAVQLDRQRAADLAGPLAIAAREYTSLLTQLNRLDEAAPACLVAAAAEPANQESAVHLRTLADAYARQQEWAKAEALYRRCVAIRRKLPESSQVPLAETLHMLAIALREQGDAPAAETIHREALGIFRKQLGNEQESSAGEAHDLAFVLMRLPGRETEAEELYREALRARRKLFGQGDPTTADTAFRLFQALNKQGKYEEADTLLNDAYAALKANSGSGSAKDFEPMLVQWIVDQYRAWGKPEKASEWERKRSLDTPARNSPSTENR